MSARTAAIRGRRLAESLMVDTARITRPGALSPHHEGRCCVRAASPGGRLDFEDGDPTQRRLDFPHDVIATVGDIVEIIGSDDVALIGERLRIVARPSQTYVMYREYTCEVIG